MRKLRKLAEPALLAQKKDAWLADFLADPDNSTKRYRYRKPEIKTKLLEETFDKCVYCEVKIGHNAPGQVEHKIPTSLVPHEHFTWANLTIACGECNRRKNNYYDALKPFLDPYSDDVEARVIHYGPTVGWPAGDATAETCITILELEGTARRNLLNRKIEKIGEINNTVARMVNDPDPQIRDLMKQKLKRAGQRDAEYSGMIRSVLRTAGLDELLEGAP